MAPRKAKDSADQPLRTITDILPRTTPAVYDQDLFGLDIPVLQSGLAELAYNINMDVLDDDHDDNEGEVTTILDYIEEEDVSIDEMALDYAKAYDSETVVLDQPTTVADYDIDVGALERKVINSRSNNPLSGISRDVLVRLPHLPYIAALRDFIEWPANGEPKFVGTLEDVQDKVLPVLSRLPLGGAYPSVVNRVIQKAAQDRGMIRQANILKEVTAKVLATSNETVDMNKTSAFYEALTADSDEDYRQDGSANFIDEDSFGMTDTAADSTPLKTVDLANTRIAKFVASKNMTNREAIVALGRQGLSETRISTILRLVAAHNTINKKSA